MNVFVPSMGYKLKFTLKLKSKSIACTKSMLNMLLLMMMMIIIIIIIINHAEIRVTLSH